MAAAPLVFVGAPEGLRSLAAFSLGAVLQIRCLWWAECSPRQMTQAQPISDRWGRRYRLQVVDTDGSLQLLLYRRQQLIGQVRCIPQGDGSLELKDIAIANEVTASLDRPYLSLLERLGYRPEPVSYRRRGLGSALLRQLIAEAEARGFKALWGEVFQPDVENTPSLLHWYQAHGFSLRPVTLATKPDLIAMLHRPLHQPATTAAAAADNLPGQD